jgi:hypothetical protein
VGDCEAVSKLNVVIPRNAIYRIKIFIWLNNTYRLQKLSGLERTENLVFNGLQHQI